MFLAGLLGIRSRASELRAALRALGKNISGYYHPLSFNEFYKVAKQNGGGLTSKDGKSFMMDTQANVEALQYMVDMQNKFNVMPAPTGTSLNPGASA